MRLKGHKPTRRSLLQFLGMRVRMLQLVIALVHRRKLIKRIKQGWELLQRTHHMCHHDRNMDHRAVRLPVLLLPVHCFVHCNGVHHYGCRWNRGFPRPPAPDHDWHWRPSHTNHCQYLYPLDLLCRVPVLHRCEVCEESTRSCSKNAEYAGYAAHDTPHWHWH